MPDVIIAVQQALPGLRRSERAVAEAALRNPGLVVDSTISQLAQAWETSTATVTRTCRALGFAGYKEFRVAFAAAQSREATARELFRVDDADIGAEDSVADLVAKIAYQEARTIEETARGIDPDGIDAVVAALARARRIDVFGVGSSGLAAQDMHLKLHRIGLVATCWPDPHLALTSAATTTPNDVAVALSHSGATREAVELLTVAGERGATTVAITSHPGSPLAGVAQHVLVASTREPTFRVGAMSSRIAQLAIVDFIVVRLVQQSFPDTSALLHATYDAVAGHRLATAHSDGAAPGTERRTK